VFEENLLELFDRCRLCGEPSANEVHVLGTLISITQECPHCKQQQTWHSQPFVRSIPAGNLLMSAAILFSAKCYCTDMCTFTVQPFSISMFVLLLLCFCLFFLCFCFLCLCVCVCVCVFFLSFVKSMFLCINIENVIKFCL
jgi:hypothetical protein